MKQTIIKKPKKVELVLHKGCRSCSRNCLFNRPVTTKDKNSQASDLKYRCNSSIKK